MIEVPANAVGDAVKRGAINAGLSKGDAGIIFNCSQRSHCMVILK